MKKDVIKEIEIPEGTKVNINEDKIDVKGLEGEVEREFNLGLAKLEKKDNVVKIHMKNSTKKEKKIINTIASHIKNMVEGVNKKFEYQLKICSSHFPISVEINGNRATIKNFLGEKVARTAKIIDGCSVEIKGDIIIVSSIEKEKAGQTAANFESATKIRNKDRRVFQDGIFMITKSGREI